MLLRFEQAPCYLQSNPYLRTGYRAFLSRSQCLESIFRWSNETINIWSHLFGFFLFFYFLIYDVFVLTPRLNLIFGDIFCMVIFNCAIMSSMASSCLYHVFSAHNEDTYKKYLKLDLDGVSLTVFGAYTIGFQTIFSCFEAHRNFLQFANAVLAVVILALHYKTKQKCPKDHQRMTVILTTWIAVGVIIPLQYAYLVGGFHVQEAQDVLVQAIVYYLFMGSAFFFYLSRYPEKCCPGKVDYLGASHQFWHFLTLSGFTWWHYRCTLNLQNRFIHGCSHDI